MNKLCLVKRWKLSCIDIVISFLVHVYMYIVYSVPYNTRIPMLDGPGLESRGLTEEPESVLGYRQT